MLHTIPAKYVIYLALLALYCSIISGLKNSDLEKTWYVAAISAITLAQYKYICDHISTVNNWLSYLRFLRQSKVLKLLGVEGYCILERSTWACWHSGCCWGCCCGCSGSTIEDWSIPCCLHSMIHTAHSSSAKSKRLLLASASILSTWSSKISIFLQFTLSMTKYLVP